MRRVLVTGGAKRIGAAIARRLAHEGWDLILHHRSSMVEAEELAKELRIEGVRVDVVQADLGGPDGVERLLSSIEGPFTALVNSASTFHHDRLSSVSMSDLDAHFRINTSAPVLLTRALLERVPEEVTGSVVNLLDAKLFGLNPDHLAYTLSKQALAGATKMTALDGAPRIRVNAVAPGLVLDWGDGSEKEFTRHHADTPLGIGVEVSDVVDAVVFLLQARSITAQVLAVDAGRPLRPAARDVMFGG